MLKIVLTAISLLLSSPLLFSQISNNFEQATSINATGSAPDASAILDVQSTEKGVLVPRMTSAQRTAIALPATGLLVFDTTTGSFWFHNGNWQELVDGGGAPPTTFIEDDDADTRISTEENPDEDIIRLEAGNFEVVKIHRDSMEVKRLLKIEGGALLAKGGTGSTPMSGAGPRLMWVPGRQAFRAGNVGGAEWDQDSIGLSSFVGGGTSSVALGSNSFVGGGFENRTTGSGAATVGGSGLEATDSRAFAGGGASNIASSIDAFVGGGQGNEASGFRAAVVGGSGNSSTEDVAFVGGGIGNLAAGERSAAVGGFQNQSSGSSAFAGGGTSNIASGGKSAVVGGDNNEATNLQGFAGGGINNLVTGQNSFVGGGMENTASGNSAFIGGGNGNMATASNSFIAGGVNNTTFGSSTFVGGGIGLAAKSKSEVAFGQYNSEYDPSSPAGFAGTDRLFSIGNGSNDGARKNAMTILKNGRMGLGIDLPTAKLHVKNGAVLAEGNTGSAPVGGAGGRFMWVPGKYAFRSGEVEGAEWDEPFLGERSFVGGGLNNKATGGSSFIGGGDDNEATSLRSVILGGSGNSASGAQSAIVGGSSLSASGQLGFMGGGNGNASTGLNSALVGGESNSVSATRGFAAGGKNLSVTGDNGFVGGGENTIASGENTFIGGGEGLTAKSFGEAVFGFFNTNYTPSSTDGLHANDRLFVVGNGTSATAPNNALTILKNGGIGIDQDVPEAPLHVNGTIIVNQKLQADDAGGLELATDEGTSRVYLNDDGRVGIGVAVAEAALHVKGDVILDNKLQADGSGGLALATDEGTGRLFVNDSGKVGIGTDAPGELLEVSSDDNTIVNITTSSTATADDPSLRFMATATGGAAFQFRDWELRPNGGDFELFVSDDDFTTSSTAINYDYDGNAGLRELHVDGDVSPITNNTHDLGESGRRWREVFATNGVINTSDAREKENIKNLHYGLAEIMQLRPVSFTWKSHGDWGTKLGLIAQEVQPLIGEVVTSGSKGELDETGHLKEDSDRLGVYYSDLIPVLINGMQEQQVIIESQKSELEKVDEQLRNIQSALQEAGIDIR